MPFIGNKPSAVPLTSADIADGIITSAKIADGTIVNADINANAAISGSKLSGAGFSGATTTSSAVDITLTSASTQTQNITMTAADKAVILPDATTLSTKGSPIYVINNQGLFPFFIKNNGGYSIIKVGVDGTSTSPSVIFLTLNDNSTANGSWSTVINNSIVGGTDFTNVITGTTGVGSIGAAAAGNFYYGISSSKISSTSAIITYQKGTSNRDVYGVVVSYSGSTITVNSETILYSGSTTAATNANVLMLDATSGFLFVSRASNNVVVPFTISGSTITAGTASSTFGVGTYNDSTTTPLGSAIAMSSTIALLTESNSTINPTFVFRTITHNGASAPTIGTVSSSVTTLYNYQAPVLVKIDSTNAFSAYHVTSTGYIVARVITISGASAPTLQTANTSSTTSADAISVISISSTKFNVVGGARSFVYTVSGTTTSYTGYTDYFTNLGNASIIAQLGDYILFLNYNGAVIYVLKILNDFYYSLPTYTSAKSYYLRAYSTFSSGYILALDSTTAFGITNNAGTTTISIQLLKIL